MPLEYVEQPKEPVLPPRQGSGAWDALVSGAQSSGTGLALRGKLPSVVLDHTHSKWYENALETVGQMVPDIPQMAAGFAGGAMAGTAVAPGPGTIVGAGAGAFAVPAAIRESLVQAYEARDAVNSADFLTRAGIVIKETAKAGVVGGLTAGTGAVAARVVGSAVAPAIGQTLSVGAGRAAIGAAQVGSEIGAMTVTPAALEGRLPEPQDFVNAAIVVGGMKAAGATAGKLAQIYAKTGRTPEEVVGDAKRDPAIAEALKAEGDKLPPAYDALAEAETLRAALPEPVKVQEIIANPKGTITDGKEPNHINYRYSESAEDVQLLRAKIAETMKAEIETARGTESWEATQAKAADVIQQRLSGMSDDQKAELNKMAFSDLAAQSMAVEAMAQRAAFDARSAATELAAKGTEATPEDMAKLVTAIEQSALLHAVDQQNGAEIARALNSRKAAAQRGQLADAMTETLAKYSNDPQVLARMVLGLHTTAELTKFAREASKATTYEKVVEAWKAGILSGPVTHVANVVGNGTFMAMRPIIDMTAAIGGRVFGASERVSVVEPFSRIFGNLEGAKDALLVAGRALEAAYDEGGIAGVVKEIAVGNDSGKSEQFRKAIEGTKGDIIRLPFRALSLADDFFSTMNSQGERYALATRQAAEEGLNVRTREFRERVADLVQNDKDIAKAADVAATRFTFNTPLGEKGQAVQNLVKKASLQLLVPFIRTPANIFKEMLRLTPLAPIIGEWRAAYEAGGAERAKAMSELAMGAAISAVVASYALDGSITGQLNADPNKRNTELASGKQPYSVKIGSTWYSYQRLQPVGTLMGMAADLAEVWKHTTEEEGNKAATMLSVAFANAVTQQTFLSGITSIVQVLADPQRYGPRFVQQYAGSVVPAIVAQPAAMLDPLQREINGVFDAIKSRVPELRETLQPRINPLTGEYENAKRRLGEVAPINMSDVSQDRVLSEAVRLQVGVSKAPKDIQMAAAHQKDIGKIKLTDEQRTIFAQESGKLIHEIMTAAVESPDWSELPDMMKKIYFEKAISFGHKKGRAEALSDDQRIAESQRIMDEVMQRMAK